MNAPAKFSAQIKAIVAGWAGVMLLIIAGLLLVRCQGQPAGMGVTPQAVGQANATSAQAANATTAPGYGNATGVAHANATGYPPGNTLESSGYEESIGNPLEAQVKKIDYALIRNMVQQGMEPDRMHLADVEVRRARGLEYHHQTLEMDLPSEVETFALGLRANLDLWAGNATLREANATTWRIASMGLTTHELHIRLPRAPDGPVPDEPPLPLETAMLVVVIDDMGESMGFARRLAALGYPVTFSVWPRSTFAGDVAAIAHTAGREVLVHQPMEPLGYPQTDPGPGAVLATMSELEIRTIVADNVSRVPYAVGMNNHMGSRFTQTWEGVLPLCRELKAQNLFVLDSLTHGGSRLTEAAAEVGLPSLRRDVFLDVVRDTDSILHQLKKAERIAARRGRAVAIGHPFPETLQALRAWGGPADEQVRMVSLSQVISQENYLAHRAEQTE